MLTGYWSKYVCAGALLALGSLEVPAAAPYKVVLVAAL